MLVAGPDRMVFPVDEVTLEPLACSCYDPWIFSQPPAGEKVIGLGEWAKLRERRRLSPLAGTSPRAS